MRLERPVPVVLHRQDLYDDVWSRPCTQIAASLGISSSALKRICTAMDIPTPSVGHWTQMQFGKSGAKAALPKAGPKTRLQWQVRLLRQAIEQEQIPVASVECALADAGIGLL
jgi:hypothetical protein